VGDSREVAGGGALNAAGAAAAAAEPEAQRTGSRTKKSSIKPLVIGDATLTPAKDYTIGISLLLAPAMQCL
jgi:hypothetical protein